MIIGSYRCTSVSLSYIGVAEFKASYLFTKKISMLLAIKTKYVEFVYIGYHSSIIGFLHERIYWKYTYSTYFVGFVGMKYFF